MNNAVIFAGGDLNFSPAVNPDDYVICADSGYRHAIDLRLQPDLLIGDFDSIAEFSAALEQNLDYMDLMVRKQGSEPKPENDKTMEVVSFPEDKDETDTLLAVQYAIEHGYNKIQIFGALGGRFDHAFANIQTLLYAHEHGAEAEIVTEREIIAVQGACTKKHKKNGQHFSVFAVTGTAAVTLKDVKYPLENAELRTGFPCGVSNEITGDECEVTVHSGVVLIVNGPG